MPHLLTETDIEAIAHGLIKADLPKTAWTHAAHWGAALWLLRTPNYDAERDMPGFIKRYNAATGTPNTDTSGYHETITRASLIIAKRRLDRAPPKAPLATILDDILRGPWGRSAWLLEHWSKPVLFSPEARHTWVGPDLKPL